MTEDAPGDRGPGREPGVGASLRAFSLRILVGTALATLAVVLALRWWNAGSAGPMVTAPSPPAGERAGERRRSAAPPPARDAALPDSSPVTPAAREVERRHAAGALSDAQKRFDRCPGGDLRRLAWIDPRSGVVKLVREREDGVTLEEWFDDEGRLREARWQGRTAAGAWSRRLALDAGGRASPEEAAGSAVPDASPPALDRQDPTAAFFSSPACPR